MDFSQYPLPFYQDIYKCERVGSFGSSGQGPGEFVAAEFIGKTEGDDTLYFVNLPSTVLLYAREEKSADSPMVNW